MSDTAMTQPVQTARPTHSWATAGVVLVGAVLGGWAVGWVGVHLIHDEHPKWLLARVSGIAALVLLTALVVLGLLLAHPRGTILRALPRATVLRAHVGLAAFTGVFTVLHVLVLALDEYAGVGWAGVLLPLGAEYRPLPVTLGWLGLYAGLAAGLSARFAGRIGRLWWPLHHTTLIVFGAVWAHGVLAGSDTSSMTLWYGASGLAVVAVAISRYLTPKVREEHA